MVRKFQAGRFVEPIPNKKLVVVASGSKLGPFRIPLESANFLLVSRKFLDPIARGADIAVINCSIAAARRQDIVQRSHDADTGSVVVKVPHFLFPRNVPDLNCSFAGPDGNVSPARHPLHRRHRLG